MTSRCFSIFFDKRVVVFCAMTLVVPMSTTPDLLFWGNNKIYCIHKSLNDGNGALRLVPSQLGFQLVSYV